MMKDIKDYLTESYMINEYSYNKQVQKEWDDLIKQLGEKQLLHDIFYYMSEQEMKEMMKNIREAYDL